MERAEQNAPASRAAGAVATKASDLPVPTFEASVACGVYCQGGTVSFGATTYPEYTALRDVWVNGEHVAALASSHADLLAALEEARNYIILCAPHSGDTSGKGWGRVMDVTGAALSKARGLQEKQK